MRAVATRRQCCCWRLALLAGRHVRSAAGAGPGPGIGWQRCRNRLHREGRRHLPRVPRRGGRHARRSPRPASSRRRMATGRRPRAVRQRAACSARPAMGPAPRIRPRATRPSTDQQPEAEFSYPSPAAQRTLPELPPGPPRTAGMPARTIAASWPAPTATSCTSSATPVLAKAEEDEVCFRCHKQQRGEFQQGLGRTRCAPVAWGAATATTRMGR